MSMIDDGRNLDPRLADVSGIAAGQRAALAPDRPMPGAGQPVWDGRDPGGTYYGQPVVKAPPWEWKVSAYLVAGGVAGTAAALAAACGPGRLGTMAMGLAAVSGGTGAGLLMADLGRPERFLNMMRVVRPTSVMNVGGYLLSATTGAAFGTLGLKLIGAPGARLLQSGAGVVGLPLSAYTGVLLGATAIPGWNIGLTTLPPLFLASGAATSGSLLGLVPLDSHERRTVAAFTIAGQTGELVAGAVLDRQLASRPRVKACYDATPGWRLGKWLTVTSVGLTVLPGRERPWRRVAACVLGVVGSSLTKTAVFSAGMRSAADPLAVPESPRP